MCQASKASGAGSANWQQRQDDYARTREEGVQRFWSRLQGRPDFFGKQVLDIGCGHGELAFDAARCGARRVVGVDIDPRPIFHANQVLQERHSELKDVLSFINADLRQLDPAWRFDCIISRDAFEHVLDLPELFTHLVGRLNPGGRLYIGFGPLYRSPYGGHRRMHMAVPWGHLVLPESWLVAWVNRYRAPEDRVSSIREMGLNQLRLTDYHDILVRHSGLKLVFWKVNHGQNAKSRLFGLLHHLPLVGELFAHDLYTILEKPK